MWKSLFVGGIVVWTCLGICRPVPAQFSRSTPRYGTFGPRALGVPLEPKERPFSDGLRFGPSGTFEGIRYRFPPWPQPDVGLAVPDAGLVLIPEVPQALVPQVMPGTHRLSDVTPPVPERPAAPPPTQQPAPPPMPELPLRRTGQELDGEPVSMGPAQPSLGQRRIGPQAISPLQVPGGPHVDLRVGFDSGRPAINQIAASLTQQLTESPRIEKLSPIQVQVEGRVAILRGVVASEYDRQVAEQAVRMQPGIVGVRNDLTVEPPR